MAAANVIDVSELPGFDEETGLLQNDDDSGNDRGLKAKCQLILCFMSHSVARYGHKETRVGLCSCIQKASISLACEFLATVLRTLSQNFARQYISQDWRATFV